MQIKKIIFYLLIFSLLKTYGVDLIIHSEQPTTITLKDKRGHILGEHNAIIITKNTPTTFKSLAPNEYELHHFSRRGFNWHHEEELKFIVPDKKEVHLWICTSEDKNRECLDGKKIPLEHCTEHGENCVEFENDEIISKTGQKLFIVEYPMN